VVFGFKIKASHPGPLQMFQIEKMNGSNTEDWMKMNMTFSLKGLKPAYVQRKKGRGFSSSKQSIEHTWSDHDENATTNYTSKQANGCYGGQRA
jgi:hypothetical protein